MIRFGALLSAIVVVGAGAPALAQDGTSKPVVPTPDPAANALSEIIVTATRRTASVQKVPLSVSVVDQAALQSLNISQTTDLTRVAPGLNFSYGSYGNANSFVLRGVSTFANSNAIESSVGVAIDGVPLGRTVGQIADAVDVERIEVLRGPQGTLFGKNSTAGLISIVTAKPTFRFEEKGSLYYGSRNELRAQGTVNAPLIGETLAMRLSAWSFSHDPYIRDTNAPHDVGSFDNKGARLRLRYAPAGPLEVNFISQYSRESDSAVGAYTSLGYVGITTPTPLTPALLAQSQAAQAADLSQGVVAGPANYASAANSPTENRVRTFYNTLQADYGIADHKLALILSYQDSSGSNINDGDQTADVAPELNSLRSDYYTTVHQYTGELRLVSPDDKRLTYVAGLFYYKVSVDTSQTQIFSRAAPFIVGRTNVSTVDSVNYASFGEITFRATDQLRFLAGGRVAHDDVDGHYVRTIPSPAIAIPNGAFGPIDVSPSTSYTNFSWRVGAQYDLAPRAMAYFTVSRGYKGPGFNFANDLTVPQYALNQAVVKPEHVTSFELGLKSELFDRSVRLNADVYYARYTDFQVSAGLPTNPLTFALINANRLIAKGAEVEIEWRATHGLTLSGNLAYSGAHFSDFPNAPCYFGQSTATCINGAYDVAGMALPNSPKLTGNVTARYGWAVGGKARAFVQANYYYKGPVYYSIGADPAERAQGYGLVNLTAGIRTADDRLGLTFFGKNVLNKHFVSRLIVSGGVIAQNLPYESLAAYGAMVDFRF